MARDRAAASSSGHAPGRTEIRTVKTPLNIAIAGAVALQAGGAHADGRSVQHTTPNAPLNHILVYATSTTSGTVAVIGFGVSHPAVDWTSFKEIEIVMPEGPKVPKDGTS